MRNLFKNISFVAFSNFFSMLVSGLATIIIPRVVSVDSYGYWQLYLLFVTYIGCIHFGLPDGIYLKYAGKAYDEIAIDNIKLAFIISSIYEIIIGIVIWGIVYNSSLNILATSFFICTVVYVPSIFLKYILLASNRIREYSIYVLVEKIFFAVGIAFLFLAVLMICAYIYYLI